MKYRFINFILFLMFAAAVACCAFGCGPKKPEPVYIVNDSTRIKSSDIKDGAITSTKDSTTIGLERRIKKLKEELQSCNIAMLAYRNMSWNCEAKHSDYENQIRALIEACNRKDQQIKILSER